MAGAGQNPDIHTQTVGPTDTGEAPSLGPEATLRSMVCAADFSLNTCQGGGRLVGRAYFPICQAPPNHTPRSQKPPNHWSPGVGELEEQWMQMEDPQQERPEAVGRTWGDGASLTRF